MAFLQSLDNVSAGKVLQVKRVMQGSSWTSTSSSLVEVINKAITPASTSNKIIARVTFRYSYPDGTKSHGGFESQLIRDSTAVNVPNEAYYYFAHESPQNYQEQYTMFTHMDTVPSATAVTYYYKCASGYGISITINHCEMVLTEIEG